MIRIVVMDSGPLGLICNSRGGSGTVDCNRWLNQMQGLSVRIVVPAIADFEQAIRLRPDYVEAYYDRGQEYAREGEIAKARADYQKVLELSRDPNMLQQARQKLAELPGK